LVLFKPIWALRDKPDMYNPVDISNLTNTQDYKGDSISFNTIDEVITYLTGINLRVKVEIEESEQYGSKNICAKFLKTNFAPKKITEQETSAIKEAEENSEDPIVDDDLPF
jgi:hypothetical protein